MIYNDVTGGGGISDIHILMVKWWSLCPVWLPNVSSKCSQHDLENLQRGTFSLLWQIKKSSGVISYSSKLSMWEIGTGTS